MSPDNGSTESLEKSRAVVAEILAPVRTHVEQLDTQIVDAEARLSELRDAKKIATRVLHAADPSTKPKKPQGQSDRSTAEREARLNDLREWLVEHASDYPEGITNIDLIGAFGVSKNIVGADTKRLQDEGFLRLDHVEGRTQFWMLTQQPVAAK